MSSRSRLTPQMAAYAEKFADSGDVRWLPYLMYFQPENHCSNVVSTDASGFRYSERADLRYSVRDSARDRPARLIAGSSTVFGIGASADRWTLASRMSENDTRPEPWLNFGGRSFNSAQEMLLLVLFKHVLPPIKEIVLFSGFNNLGLARLPEEVRLEHGAFFNCREFFDALPTTQPSGLKFMRQRLFGKARPTASTLPDIAQQIESAADLTIRHLHTWSLIARDMGAKLTFVLQPLSGWVRSEGCREEEDLFKELDELGRFSEVYGDILDRDVCTRYAEALRAGVEGLGDRFVNFSPVLAATAEPDQWLFVDRIHFTDDGHDFVSKRLLEILQ